MLRHPHDPDAHIRALLDQRQPRFSAVSDYSDTPSVYSRPYFSPRPTHDTNYDYPSPVDDEPPHQPSSMLDLDDDPRASYTDSYDDDSQPYEPRDDTPADARLSYLGPKMRFHSRAPWELEDGDLEEEDEPEESPRHFGAAFPFARRRPSGSSSPRPSFQTTRPSGESSRSQVLPKRSFDTTNSQTSYSRGALYALAQESMSTTSLGRITPHQPKETLRSKLSLGRLRPDTPTGPLPPPPVPPLSPAHTRFPPSSPTFERPQEIHSAPAHESTHPYANPDLVVSYAEDNASTYHNGLGSHYISSRNNSNLTVTEGSSTDSMAKSSSQATLTPDSSINSITSKSRSSAILVKNISSPVPVNILTPPGLPAASDRSQDHSAQGLPPGVSNLAGWTERNTAPTFSLISLEEARAQRMRGTTTSAEASRASSSSGSRASSAFPLEDNEASNTSQGSDGSPLGSIPTRTRGRSVSAGSKAKSALQTIVGQPKADRQELADKAAQPTNNMSTATGGRSLKHKKSGFMRLFNGGKVLEKDERDDPPPVPSLPEQHSGSSSSINNTYQAQQRVPKSVQRIPVPSLSPSLYEVASMPSNDSVASESLSRKGGILNLRRTPPALSIRTMPPVSSLSSARASVSAVVNNTNSGYAHHFDASDDVPAPHRPWATNEQQPQSAPAQVTEFSALRLRPVSTLFSAHFSEHLVPLDDVPRSPDGETNDPSTPRSATSPLAPITPPVSALSPYDNAAGGDGEKNTAATGEQQQLVLSARTPAWQQQIWELEGQVRDLKAELEAVSGRYSDEYCSHCGRGKKAPASLNSSPVGGSVINRPRARTGTSSRFGKTIMP